MGVTGLEVIPKKNPEIQHTKGFSKTTPTTPISARVQNWVQFLQKNSNLAEIVESWPDLPEHIKAAIKALVEAHK